MQAEEAAQIEQFPHCDQRVLHAPGECEYCDERPGWQSLRKAWGIAFTGHVPAIQGQRCGRPLEPKDRPLYPGASDICRLEQDHDGACSPQDPWERLPCPADAARPPGSDGDHRRGAGNKPTAAEGDPSWPAESAASVALYGDKGGRQP